MYNFLKYIFKLSILKMLLLTTPSSGLWTVVNLRTACFWYTVRTGSENKHLETSKTTFILA